MKQDIRAQTGIVIEKDGEFLVGYCFFLRFALSPYDAWRTRDREKAHRVADRIGGNMMLFNPVVGQIRRFKGE